jgi:hypothetical protein
MVRFARTAVIASMLWATSSAPANAVTITVTLGGGRSAAWDGTGPDATNVVTLASPPFFNGPATAVDGSSSSSTTYDFTNSELLIEFTHARTGANSGGYAYSDDSVPGALGFRVDSPITALISGAYTVSDTGSGDRVFFELVLSGESQATLHQTKLESRVSANESFVVGQNGGDLTDIVLGSTTQLLVPGITYTLNWIALIQDLRSDAGDTGATANGFFSIQFVPEPSTALLFALGLAGLAASRAHARDRL